MRNLILSSLLAFGFVTVGAAAWQANAAVVKGTPPTAATQTEPVRCFLHAPVDGCGWGWYRGRHDRCRPC